MRRNVLFGSKKIWDFSRLPHKQHSRSTLSLYNRKLIEPWHKRLSPSTETGCKYRIREESTSLKQPSNVRCHFRVLHNVLQSSHSWLISSSADRICRVSTKPYANHTERTGFTQICHIIQSEGIRKAAHKCSPSARCKVLRVCEWVTSRAALTCQNSIGAIETGWMTWKREQQQNLQT